ncbi:oligosaccharide flippase family protein [Alkalicaulis satelles]|nr:oligosaccharide flippase family protein [Alkalicaulis satelles]
MLNRHLLAYLPVYAAQAVVGFGSVIVFTRLLTPDEYGRYMLLLAGAALIGTAVFTWLDAAVARHHARCEARGRMPGHLFTAWRIYGVLALVSVLLAGAVIALIPMDPALRTACAFALAYTVIRSGVTLAMETRRAARQAGRFSALETFTLAAGFGLGVVFAHAGLGAAGPFAGMALAGLIVLLIEAPIHLSRARRDRADAPRAIAYFAYGGPVAFSLIFEHLLSVGDRFLIAAFMGEAAVGAYSAGYALADRSLSIIFLWLGMTTGPLLVAALEHEGREAARAVARRTGALMGLLGFPAALGLILVAEPAAHWLIGAEIAGEAAGIIPFIALSGLMNGIMTFYFHEAYVLGRRPRAMAAVMTAAAGLNLALNLVLIPLMGLTGAALATVISYGAALSVCVIHGRSVFPLPIPSGDWLRAGAAALVMGAAILALPDLGSAPADLFARIAVGAIVYAIAALALDAAGCRSQLAAPILLRLTGARA